MSSRDAESEPGTNEKRIRSQRSDLAAQRLVLAPYSVWAVLFILVPLAFVAYYAFTDSELQLHA